MKKIGFLSFGHWSPSPQSQARSASDALLQSIDLAVAAEELGADGAYFRVHHFASQLASPFPLLAAIGARTSRIEIGTGVIDMRYENPLYMAEDAGAADLISGGRLQLGISRGSPEQVIDGFRYFGYEPAEGSDHADMAREHTRVFLEVIRGEGFASPTRGRCSRTRPACCGSSRTRRGCATASGGAPAPTTTAEWAAEQGMNLMSSTLLTEDTGVPFHRLQAEQIERFRTGLEGGGSRARAAGLGQPQHLPGRQRPGPRLLRRRAPGAGTRSVSWTAARPVRQDVRRGAGPLVKDLAEDEAIAAADTCCSRSRTSSASTTTRTCSTACCGTSRPGWAGAEAAAGTTAPPRHSGCRGSGARGTGVPWGGVDVSG